MADRIFQRRWFYQVLFVGLGAVFLFFRILPLSTLPPDWPGPDLMVALTFAWVLRRPEYLPAVLVAVVFLLEDMLYQRPPGLWAALVLLGSEFLRGRVALMRGLPFLVEWAVVAAVLAAMMAVNRLVLAIALVPQVGLLQDGARVLMTLLAYPVAVWFAKAVFSLDGSEAES